MTLQQTWSDDDARPARLKQAMAALPFISGDLPGVGGAIKAEPEHFQVEEILPYEACGEGEHVYVTLRRKGWNTVDVGAALARQFCCRLDEIGWGGRKDRHAVCTQTFSLPLPQAEPLSNVEEGLTDLPFEILDVRRHRNKIKTGHVAANRFEIVLSQVSADSLLGAAAIAERLRRDGLPNFYGEQRFGIGMNNIDSALGLLACPRKARGAKGAFMVSVLQSALFNLWLAARMHSGAFGTILPGDLVRKTDTGGLFVVEDVAEATERFERRAIVFTGPMYGHKMKPAAGEAAHREARLLDEWAIDAVVFKSLRAVGTRRPALLWLTDLTIDPHPEGLLFRFTLPSGAFATTVMREFIRTRGETPLV